ncbi:glycosyltransferase [Candidatus Vecturithrix granuli]|uniref:Glycosyltransferase n=1 Tax=Vecturithrix granuli TaxID=1499967 RepID=A0A081BZY4_VECG1|nr:glycosyltransferase [Candidatus Vecturithrix granuli]
MVDAEKRLKICFLGSARYTFPLDTTTEKKFRLLSTLGDLFVIGFSKTFHPWRFTQHARFYALPLLPLAPLRYLEFWVAGSTLMLWCIFRHDCRIIIAQSPYEGVAAALVKKISRWSGRQIILIVESHGDFEKSFFLYRRIIFSSVYRKIMKQAATFSLKHADLLRSVSGSSRQQLVRWRPDCQIFTFVAWTDIDVFLHNRKGPEENFSQTLLYAGMLIPCKGVIHLINAFAAVSQDFPQAQLIIVGKETDQEYTATLKAQVNELGLEHRVQFIPEVPQQELAQIMRKADVFVLPSYSEGLPRVIIEAMAVGLPVIASDVGGISEIVQDHITGLLVPPGNETVLSEKLRWLLQSPEHVVRLGHNAHQSVNALFSTEAYLQGYSQIFTAAQVLMKNRVR